MTYTPLEPLSQHPEQVLEATFAGYTIVRLLGYGAMGEVYLAEHPRLPRRDALKILRTDVSADEDYRQRFIREADQAATLWHPNIVRVNDRGEFDGQLWIAMDYVDGMDAARLLAQRYPTGMPLDQVAAIVAAVADALDYAHQHGLLHRDVKPANILVANTEGDEQRILLSDFGIARSIGDISGLTATNMTIGTLPYAAPEQLMDEPMDGRADQYALAATAYHLLTGSPLFPQSNPAVVIGRHLNTPPPALADTRPALAALDPVLATALAKDSADRFTRCTDFARAFAQAAQPHGHTAAAAPTMQAPVAGRTPASTAVPSVQADTARHKRRRRHRMVLGAVLAVAVLTATGVIGYIIEKNNTASRPAPAAAVLDGTYRLDFDLAKQTANGAPAPSTDHSNPWWAFRSSCTSTGCVATGTQLDEKNHQVAATPTHTAEFHFVDGLWQRTPVQTQAEYPRCLGADGKVVAGADTETVGWSLEPQPDGTLRGVWSDTALTNECGNAGTVWQAPLAATRTGDVPPTVTVADSAAVIATPVTQNPIPAVAGVTPVLNGTFQVVHEWSQQTENGQAIHDPAPPAPSSEWYALRSLCTSAGCIATGALLANENHQLAVGGGIVLRFVDGHWQDTQTLLNPRPCPGATGSNTTHNQTTTWSWEPQPDGSLRGFSTTTAITNECRNQGDVWRTPLSITRRGDVPPTVVLADPALFAAPAAPATGGHN